jgi:hypothetical protein
MGSVRNTCKPTTTSSTLDCRYCGRNTHATAGRIELRVIDSPAKIAVTGLTAAQAEQIVVAHADRFLGWWRQRQRLTIAARRLRDRSICVTTSCGRITVGKLVSKSRPWGPDLGMTVAAVNTDQRRKSMLEVVVKSVFNAST